MKATPRSDQLAITTQFRSRRATVYEFQGFGSKLSVRVSPREADSDAGEWRVEAGAAHGPTDVTIVGWGATRAETLKQVGCTWKQEGPGRGLPDFDWDEVARLLSKVSAI